MKPPASLSITVLGNGRQGTPKALLVDSGSTRYLVNCGEGTQRILTEHRSKASRIQHVFFTQMSWDHVSGLLGVALTARTAGVKKLTVHGPPKVEELMCLTRHFADCETTDIVASEILSQPFIDSAFKVQAFTLAQHESTSADEPDLKRSKCEVETSDPRHTTYAYYFQPFQPRRKLDKAKCLTMAVPRSIFESPLVRDFLEGRNVTMPDGSVITADQVTSPAPPSPNFLVIDCPSTEFIPTLINSETLLNALRSPSGDENLLPGVSLVIHLVPEGLYDSPDYQRFVQTLNQLAKQHCAFDKERLLEQKITMDLALLEHPIHHLVVDGTGCLPAITGLYGQSAVLHQCFDRQVYPLPYDMCCIKAKEASQNALKQLPEPHATVVCAEPQTQYLLRPWQGFSRPESELLDVDRLCNEAFEPLYVTREEAEKEFTTMRAKLVEDGLVPKDNSPPNISAPVSSHPYPEITFLGTGSSSPNKYRNISCILVQTSPDDFIMMDCGEGSLNQMYAMYGRTETEHILRKLKLILVTHMHADHHGGIFSVALARSRLLAGSDNTIYRMLLPVMAPPAFARWMTSFLNLFHHGPTVDLYVLPSLYQSPCPPDLRPPLCPLKSESPKRADWVRLLHELELEISPIRVPHTGTSWAYLIRGSYNPPTPGSNQWSLVYSGDTPPCNELIDAGQGCDLLIHEATMIDEHRDLAERAKHSTLGSAIEVGHAMRAKFTLLNHFSQRYGRLPMLDKFIPDVAVTFDLMKIRMDDLRRLPYYVPYYKYAFAKHWDAQQVKAEAYSWRKFREQAMVDTNSASESSKKLDVETSELSETAVV